MKNFIFRLWNDEQGQSTTEYILILAVVVMIAMKFKGLISGRLEGLMNTVGNQIDGAVQGP